MTTAASLAALTSLVVKTGVALGGLPARDRELALALAAASLAEDAPASEAVVNRSLKRCLAEEASFLDTDHVELRRWLVDAGWWQRDGFGRVYRRVAIESLPASMQGLDGALRSLDLPVWVQARRDDIAARRKARRGAWQSRPQTGPAT
jgi:Uncharacterized protein conserved in bacteria (DUF2087)